mgnify:FL=1
MNAIWNNVKEGAIDLCHNFGWAWWLEIDTQNPLCTYYFGPFLTAREAQAAKTGYVEDLEQEGATEITAIIKRCKPEKLTVSADLA